MANIAWAAAAGGSFQTASDWSGDVVPLATDGADLGALGVDYVVTSGVVQTVAALTLATDATLDVTARTFTTTLGTAAGANAGVINVSPGAVFAAGGAFDNTGLIQLNQSGSSQGSIQGATLSVGASGLTLTGGGSLYLEDPVDYTTVGVPAPPGLAGDLVSSKPGGTLTNVDNVIHGAGRLGESGLGFINEAAGVVDADQTTPLTFNSVGGGLTNDGLMEDTGGGGLYFVSTTVDQTGGGVIAARGGIVYFSYSDVIGGTLTASAGSEFYWDHGTTILDGSKAGGLVIQGKAYISNGAQLGLKGAIANTGVIGVGNGPTASEVIVDASGVRLSGGGSLTLQGEAPNDAIVGAGSGSTLTNVNDTILGQGMIGGDDLVLVNGPAGVIDADLSSSLSLTAHVTNTGLLETTGSGGLVLSDTIANAHGLIEAKGPSTVVLSGASIQGGALETVGAGEIEVTQAGATLDGVASTMAIRGDLVVDAGANLTGLGGLTLSGTLVVDGTAVLEGPLESTAKLDVEGGSLTVDGAVTGGGKAILDGGDLTFGSTFNQSVTFGSSGELTLADARDYTALVVGFSTDGGTSLDLEDIGFVNPEEATFKGSAKGGYLSVTDGQHEAKIHLTGDFEDVTFTAASDGQGGVLVSTQAAAPRAIVDRLDMSAAHSMAAVHSFDTAVPCYCPGTLILTDRGEVAVEALQIGDRLVTASGEAKPLKWIGRRNYNGRFLAGDRRRLPVCVKAGAMGGGLPRRDLWISPLHAMVVDGALVPAGALVNGVSVTQASGVDEVHYIHLELQEHSVIYAEGAASESFVDDDSRAMFQNAWTYAELYPDARSTPAAYCLPRVEDGEDLERLRTIVDGHAGLTRSLPQAPELRGHLDRAAGGRVEGWAQAQAYPEAPVCLDVLVDGVLAATVLANRYRADLEQAGLGSGRHAFSVALDLAPGAQVEVRRALDGALLACEPVQAVA
jgi:hypothetical protein